MLHMILTVVQVFSSVAIIALVLLQRGKGAEAGAGFGAGASGTVFGARGARTALSRATAVFAAIFMMNSLALAYMGREASSEPKSILDEAARSVLRRVGLDKYFTHSTGHGVGLEIHEGPRLAAKQTQVLEQGMVITIEPGVYMPGRFGLRIEDMVLVTARGGEVLTPSVKAWIEL